MPYCPGCLLKTRRQLHSAQLCISPTLLLVLELYSGAFFTLPLSQRRLYFVLCGPAAGTSEPGAVLHTPLSLLSSSGAFQALCLLLNVPSAGLSACTKGTLKTQLLTSAAEVPKEMAAALVFQFWTCSAREGRTSLATSVAVSCMGLSRDRRRALVGLQPAFVSCRHKGTQEIMLWQDKRLVLKADRCCQERS